MFVIIFSLICTFFFSSHLSFLFFFLYLFLFVFCFFFIILFFLFFFFFFFFQAEDGIRDKLVTGVQTCALPICGFVNRSETVESIGLAILVVDTPANNERAIEELNRLICLAQRFVDCTRSEERRVGKECRSRWWTDH